MVATPPNPPARPATPPRAGSLLNSNLAVQPEQMSLTACSQVRDYLSAVGQANLSQEELNAILRLSQHLRVFGLLSAVGYLNQTNDQAGAVRTRTVPVWRSLLGAALAPGETLTQRQLMERVQVLAQQQPQTYMATWQQVLTLSQHWNFWARAYLQN